MRVRELCKPLPEKVFKDAIGANYHSETHFYFELNHVQTDALLALLTRNVKALSSSYMKPQTGPSVPKGGNEEDWIKPKKTAKSVRDAWHNSAPFIHTPEQRLSAQPEGRGATPEDSDGFCEDGADERSDNENFESEVAVNKGTELLVEDLPIQKSLDWRSNVLSSNRNETDNEEDRKKAEMELEVLEKLKQLQKLNMQGRVEVKAEAPWVQNDIQREAAASGTTGSNKRKECALSEWEKLARERCLQEQTMLREEREQLRGRLQSLDVPVAKTISKNLELCASALAQMRQDEIKLRHVMDEASNQVELSRELDKLKKKNAMLEYTQVQMASELESLKSDVTRMSQQLEALLQGDRRVNGVVLKENTYREEKQESLQQVYLLGGHNGQSWLGTVDILCPATHEFTSVAPMLTARSYAAASVLMGQIYVFGGGNGRLWYETVETYNSGKDEWIPCSPMSLRRGSLAGATVGDRIFALGGGNGQVYFSDVECYDAHLGMWIGSTSMLNKRFGVAAAGLDGALYAVGGYNDQNYLESVERFDPREALWTAVAPMNKRRGSLSAASLGGKIYAIGGYDGVDFLNSVEFYEPRTNCWIEMEMGMHIGRAYGAVARVGNSLYMFGGLNGGPYVDTVERYRENTGWEIVEDAAMGRRCFLACAVLE